MIDCVYEIRTMLLLLGTVFEQRFWPAKQDAKGVQAAPSSFMNWYPMESQIGYVHIQQSWLPKARTKLPWQYGSLQWLPHGLERTRELELLKFEQKVDTKQNSLEDIENHKTVEDK